MMHRRTKRAYPTIEAWRNGTGTSQGDLAKLLGISQSHLCNIERGNRKASLDLALRIAKLTNVPIETIAESARVA